jgi:hypothetical protein
MEIRVHVPRPLITLTLVSAFILWWSGIISINLPGGNVAGDALGGAQPQAVIATAEQDINREKIKQAVLGQQEEILRYQVQILEAEALKTQTPESAKELNDARAVLLGIIKNRSASEKLLAQSLQELWEAPRVHRSILWLIRAFGF